ncbi:unnamed protein product [marine sediment metagenome]|uniref:Uncharacterized protein n=1 Tax=marine sediment metagenome TaxID=412755 RepID=X0YD50_9ZZZZ
MEYNPTRTGAVLVFKEGVNEEDAAKALEKLKALLDHTPRVNTFDPEWGGPVWYVP